MTQEELRFRIREVQLTTGITFSYVVRTMPHESISKEIRCNVGLITLYDTERRRDGVSNKEVSDQKVEKRCTTRVKLWY